MKFVRIQVLLISFFLLLAGCALPDPSPAHTSEVSGSLTSVDVKERCLYVREPGTGTTKQIYWDHSTRILREGKRVDASAFLQVEGELISSKVASLGSKLVANTIAIPDTKQAPKIPGLKNLRFIPANQAQE